MTRSKPLALGVTVALVFGASGVSAQARVASVDAAVTTPGQHLVGPGTDDAVLASRLGVSVPELHAAVRAVRSAEGRPDRAAQLARRDARLAGAVDAAEAAEVKAAREARAARFARQLAVQLGLGERTVAAAVDAARTAAPTRAGKVETSQRA